ncbi:HAD-IA family hydrolase [Candidatus Woesearchaeota archaeon]|nr:HAD-IA family hydrolase [Candidatus Woesearchaeota archaeon]MBW3018253.1 HAD-IA family hydrolase [Candidatus Woesearchaeota archaeon]
MAGIETVAFDFGGVFFTYAYRVLVEDLVKELDVPFRQAAKAFLNSALDHYQKGILTETDYWDVFESVIGKNCDRKKLRQIMMDHHEPIPESWDLVERLRKKYRVAMLSNHTNWLDEINEKHDFYPLFDPIIISVREGTKKPEERIWQILIERSHCAPQQIVMIDDFCWYKHPVEKAGMKFITYKVPHQLERDLKALGLEL